MITRLSQSPQRRGVFPGRCGALALVLLLAVAAGGCAGTRGSAEALNEEDVAEANDPLEGLNRQVFAINLAIDTFLLRPAAVAYRELVPEPGKIVVRNFVNNLKLPFTFLNDLAQGQFDRAGTALGRFLVNTTLGIGGLFDPATDLGLEHHKEDFGQTLAVWGIEDGPYLVLPLFGPSNFRDAIGTAVGWVADPVKLAADAADAEEVILGASAADGVDARYRNLGTIDNLRERSLDFYATVRSLYRQRRENEIRNGAPGPIQGGTPLSEHPAPPPAGTLADVRHASPAADAAETTAGASPSPAGVGNAIAALPENAEGQRAAEPIRLHVEPIGPSAPSLQYIEALRAFEAAARAYERAVRSDESGNSEMGETQ